METLAAPPKIKSVAAPTASKERIVILDSLRGFAILGILLMNIASMGSPFYSDPSVLNETGWNYKSWFMMSWFFDGTQRALFSLLFGAGIVLFITNQEKKGGGLKPADLFFRRQLWLLVFALINIYIFLWHGDILFDYACYGMLMFVFRDWQPKILIAASLVCMLIMIGVENKDLYAGKRTIARGEAIQAVDTSVTKLNALQKDDLNAMLSFKSSSEKEAKIERANKAIERMTSEYRYVYESRTESYRRNFFNYSYFGIWDVLQFMFLGMAFYKNGVLTARHPKHLYLWMALGGFAIGLFLSNLRVQDILTADFNNYEYTKNATFSIYELDRFFRTFGIFGCIMLLYKSGIFNWLFYLMKAPGQMAFTNYLMQSIIAFILFYGMGFALYGQLERHQLYLVVFGIWIFQILFSHIWLHYFLFGPFEWAWRSLTYWKMQPIKKTNECITAGSIAIP